MERLYGYVPTESDEQEMLFQWVALAGRAVPDLGLLYHVPNGGFRNKVTGARLKKEGVKAGVPDLFLPVPTDLYHGLYIELKKRDFSNKPTQSQKWWIAALRKKGYRVEVCYGADEAIGAICDYLGIVAESI